MMLGVHPPWIAIMTIELWQWGWIDLRDVRYEHLDRCQYCVPQNPVILRVSGSAAIDAIEGPGVMRTVVESLEPGSSAFEYHNI
ncbi:uncharacterized protein BJ212DRAFT_134128 [Suillus subaureus]|uniref:Uncharacterized protein n=1 Tax=Suillus subaureus TaxID=48587 RepID=A0A9P7J2W6_9AGAM|nr:uncharacterized protein BJ212DRAFT_134128 [Suillus subaureus]KAG1800014.1 hypothetical protein BJ212DRAFT_134128 [Suillus subaureus]